MQFFGGEIYIGEEDKKSMMDHLERIRRILDASALYWCLHMIVRHVLNMQALALNDEWKNALFFSINLESVNMSDCSVWALEKNVGFTDRLLLGSFTGNKFLSKVLMNLKIHSSFLSERIGLYL